MLCFEVYRNGQKLCTAGIGDFGVLTAILAWVSHEPEKLRTWAESGVPEVEATRLDFGVSGLRRCVGEAGEHLRWAETSLAVGDEIRIRVVDLPGADPPSQRHEHVPSQLAVATSRPPG